MVNFLRHFLMLYFSLLHEHFLLLGNVLFTLLNYLFIKFLEGYILIILLLLLLQGRQPHARMGQAALHEKLIFS